MKIREIHIRWLGILVVALIAVITMPEHMSDKPWWFVYFIAFMFTAVYWNGACMIIFGLRRKFPEISKVRTRLIWAALGVLLWMSIGGIPVRLLFQTLPLEDVMQPGEHTKMLPFNFIVALVITLSYEAVYFFEKWKETFRLNEELKNRQIRTQFEVLQNQMSPHFLFNSLNTLASIIPENTDTAVSFTENLSEVYRYILRNKERELVSLKEELEFVKAYLHLLKARYPDNLTVGYQIDPKFESLTIPPLTLQMLVENAIKHNVVSKSRPLHIDIYVENGRSVVVKNNLQKKENLEKSTQTGLDNIRKRYSILSDRQVDVIMSATNFMVAVPLIDLLNEKDLKLA
jgi:uncharacterized membrane protein